MAKQSKKEAERTKAQEHKRQLAASKAARREAPLLERNNPTLNEKPVLLIYCEGKNTEPSYFNKFKIPSVIIKAYGEGRNTLSLVKQVKKIVKKAKKAGKPFEEVWCVFDADPKGDNPKQLENFNKAVELSNKSGYGTAYSNQAFEYWLLIHFEDHQGGAMQRTDYSPKLNGYLKPYGSEYEGDGSKMISQEFFDILFEITSHDKENKPITRTNTAIERAKKICKFHDNQNNPGKKESSTKVYQLVEKLLELNK